MVNAINKSNEAHNKEISLIQERIDASKELVETIKAETDESLSELSVHEDLYEELTGIVDQNGKIKEGYEERAQFITDQLSQAYGTEIKIVDGVIEKYDELTQTFDELMDKKRADVIVQSYAQAWEDSAKKIGSAEEEMKQAKKNFEESEKQLKAALESASNQTSDLGIINQMTVNEQRAYEEARETYNKSEESYKQYLQNMQTYEQLYQAALEGDYEKVNRIHQEGISVTRETINTSSVQIAEEYATAAQQQSKIYGNTLEKKLKTETERGIFSAAQAMIDSAPQLQNAAQKMVNSVSDPIKSLNPVAWGADLVIGVVKGIEDEIPIATAAASGLAAAISAYLHFTRPDKGPLREYEKWPVHFVDRYSELLKAQQKKLSDAAQGLSFELYSEMENPKISSFYNTANEIENRINANINPARQEITVNLAKGTSQGMSLNQTNNFYSPQALSPAETARLNRINVRNTIKAMR